MEDFDISKKEIKSFFIAGILILITYFIGYFSEFGGVWTSIAWAIGGLMFASLGVFMTTVSPFFGLFFIFEHGLLAINILAILERTFNNPFLSDGSHIGVHLYIGFAITCFVLSFCLYVMQNIYTFIKKIKGEKVPVKFSLIATYILYIAGLMIILLPHLLELLL